jgi:2-succinyl-6-hydroxy-2,4-cyclohexadiene-1-carboxylate synthase
MERVELRQGARGGPIVTFLHGFLGAPEQAAAFAAKLPVGISVEAFVLPGHGPRPWTPEGSFTEIAGAMAQALAAHERRVLLGYSLGGRLALAMAAVAPDAFRSVIAVGAHLGFAHASEREERRRIDAARAELVRREGLGAFVDAWEKEPLFATQASVPASLLDEQRRWRSLHTTEGVAWSLEHLGTAEMPRLDPARGATRVALVAGGLDEKFAAIARDAAWGSATLGAAIIPGVGHNVVLEAPEALAAIVASRCPWPAGRPPRRTANPAKSSTKDEERKSR